MGAKLSILLLVLFGISQVALSLKQKNRSVSQKQYAELFAPGYGYELYELTPSDGIPDADEAINSIVITKLEKEKEVLTKPPEMLDRHHRLENRAQEERIHALTRPDDSYHVMRPELMRQKRDIPAWQAAYSHRFRAYVRAKQETITPEGGRKKKKSRHVARRKFARQFDADETAPNQDDNSIEEKRNQMEQEENLDREIAVGTVEPTTVTKIRRKKNKRKTTTARTTTTTTSTTTTTTTVRTPSDDDRYDAPDDVVQDIIEDLQKKEEHPSNENVPTWARKHLESALDTRNNQELKDMIVDKHDYLRSMVSPPAADMMKMEWNEEAAKVAQWWAEQCQFKHDPGEGRHNSQFQCGQNLAKGWPRPLSWNLTMQLWFDERKDLQYGGAIRGMIGHYTQLVWSTSYQVGCGYHDCGSFHHYVCNYCPAGNVDTRITKPYKAAEKFCASCPNDCLDGKLCTNTCGFHNKYGNCDQLQKEFSVCTDASYGLQSACQATCKCKGKLY